MTTELSIKLEGNELQTYLETFNDELETNGQPLSVIQADVDNDDDDGGTYFVDESGNYYYQANKDAEPILTDIQAADVENVQYIVDEDDVLLDEPVSAPVTRTSTRLNKGKTKNTATASVAVQRTRTSKRNATRQNKNVIDEQVIYLFI